MRNKRTLQGPVAFQAHAPRVPICNNVRWDLIWTSAIYDYELRRQVHVRQTRFSDAVTQRNHEVWQARDKKCCQRFQDLWDGLKFVDKPAESVDVGLPASMPGCPDKDGTHSAGDIFCFDLL